LEALVTQHGQPKYRAKQLLDGILQGARSLDDIKGLPKTFIEVLKSAGVRTGRSILHKSVSAPDGTQKFLLQLQDGRVVETVGIPNDSEPTVREGGPDTQGSRAEDSTKKSGRLTVCVSSQVCFW
jgi:23S rRNA (adenine2503-C2)-methyltransferase